MPFLGLRALILQMLQPENTMKIAFVSTMSNDPWGGSELLWSETALRLRRKGRTVAASVCGLPEDAFAFGACGTLGWRKWTDLFLQIARSEREDRISPDAALYWADGPARNNDALELDYDVRALGLEGRCQRVPATSDVLDYYCAMNVFALPSREDPFPLVMLEAASHGVPTVCFEGSGGAQDFVEQDAGAIAPYLDVAGFAEHLIRLRKAPALCRELGAAASTKVRMRYGVETQGAEIAEHHRAEHDLACVNGHTISALKQCSFSNESNKRKDTLQHSSRRLISDLNCQKLVRK